MEMLKLIFVFLTFGVFATLGRHIHHSVQKDGSWKTERVEIDGMTVDMLSRVGTAGIVPVNNIVFFRKQEPCEEGLKRDLFGMCREVWDD